MLEKYKIITLTHKRVNLREIGAFVVSGDAGERLKALKTQFQLGELFYLATCNRVMYFFVSETPLDAAFAKRFLSAVNTASSSVSPTRLDELVDTYSGIDAIEHLFEVAASIDSLVVGERQILRQLREAYEACRAWGLSGDLLRLAIEQTIVAAKGVYANTRIGDKPVSVVSLAMRKLMGFHPAKDARIVLVGAGQTNQLVAKFLVEHGFQNVVVFNRSLDKALALADTLGGQAYPLADLANYRDGFDFLIVCTGATSPVISTDIYECLRVGETERKVIIDLAIPHNVDPLVTRQPELHYIEIDGLRHLAKENLAFREREVTQARTLLNKYLRAFPKQVRQREIEYALREVPEAIREVKEKAIGEVFHKEMQSLDDNARALVERMLAYMEKKCVGIPMRAAKEALH
jgi:glutamyl-tRNA reductase